MSAVRPLREGRAVSDADTVRAGVCPICQAGPFKVVLFHVSRVHRIPGRQARHRFGLTLSETVCDPDIGELRRQVARRVGPPTNPNPRRHRYRCAACGRTFLSRAYRDDQGQARYCSAPCRWRGPR